LGFVGFASGGEKRKGKRKTLKVRTLSTCESSESVFRLELASPLHAEQKKKHPKTGVRNEMSRFELGFVYQVEGSKSRDAIERG